MALNFTQALMDARRRAQLTGRPLSAQEVSGIASGYFADAAARNDAARRTAIAQAGQTLAEKAQTAQENQWAQELAQTKALAEASNALKEKELAQQNSQFGQNLSLQQESLSGQLSAAEQARKMQLLQTGISGAGSGALIYGAGKMAGLWGTTPAPAASEAPAVLSGPTTVAVGGSEIPLSTLATGAGLAYGGSKLAELTSETKEIPQEVSEVGSTIASIFEAPLKAVGGGTWLCTEIEKYIGLTDDDKAMLSKLRRYAVKHYKGWMRAYWDKGKALVDGINAVEDKHPFYEKLKDEMVNPIINAVRSGGMEEAYQKYKDDTIALFEKYAPEIEICEA